MNCLYCNENIKGRSDKKFCDSNCRNAWHNSRINPAENEIKKINKILRRNRSILRFCSPKGKTTIKKDFLVQRGFNFRFITQTYTTKNGNTYLLCYDYGYFPLPDDKILIINKQSFMDES